MIFRQNLVEVGLIVFMIKYRARPGRKAEYIEGSTKAEIIWTTVPAVTLVIIGLMSGGVWNTVKGRNSVPADAIPYGLHAQQFEWNITYRGPDGQLGTADDFTVRNQLHIPVNQPVVMRMTAEDVILMKLLWRKDTQSQKQWDNALGVAKVKGARMDWKYLFGQAGQLGVKEDLVRLRDEAGI